MFTPLNENQIAVQMSVAIGTDRSMTVLRFLGTGLTWRFGHFMLNGFLAVVVLAMVMTTEFFGITLVHIHLSIHTANRCTGRTLTDQWSETWSRLIYAEDEYWSHLLGNCLSLVERRRSTR